MRRIALGIIALLLICVGTYFTIWPPAAGSQQFMHGSTIKAGAVLAAIWLAYPQLEKLPGWVFAAVLIASLVIAIRPRLALIVLPLLAFIWMLKPKSSGAPKGRPTAARKSESPPG